jgi:hypothetical protein
MKKFMLALLFVSSTVYAVDQNNPYEKFDATKNFTTQSVITWRAVGDVAGACNAERSKRGLPTFKQPSMACSFWDQNSCLIITGTNTDRDTVGHEIQHCFQGKWH